MKYTVSVVIPFFNSLDTIKRTLKSLGSSWPFELEVVVVDDGSDHPFPDSVSLIPSEVSRIVTKIRLEKNVGKAAACNFAFSKTSGDLVIILDSDDELVANWAECIVRLIDKWPASSPLAFAHTVTEEGNFSGTDSGIYTREQWLNGEGRGEYLPIIRGRFAREYGYLTPGCRKICGTLSYARLLENGPLYIHPEVVRKYYTNTVGSITKDPFSRHKARDSYICFHAARVSIEAFDRQTSQQRRSYLPGLYFRESIYQIFGVSRLSGLSFAINNGRIIGLKRMLVVFLITILPRYLMSKAVIAAKHLSLLPKYG